MKPDKASPPKWQSAVLMRSQISVRLKVSTSRRIDALVKTLKKKFPHITKSNIINELLVIGLNATYADSNAATPDESEDQFDYLK